MAIKPFSKWRPSDILNLRNLVFWSCDLCLNIYFLIPNFASIGQQSVEMCNVNMHCKTDILTDEVSERHIDIKYVDEGS